MYRKMPGSWRTSRLRKKRRKWMRSIQVAAKEIADKFAAMFADMARSFVDLRDSIEQRRATGEVFWDADGNLIDSGRVAGSDQQH